MLLFASRDDISSSLEAGSALSDRFSKAGLKTLRLCHLLVAAPSQSPAPSESKKFTHNQILGDSNQILASLEFGSPQPPIPASRSENLAHT